MLPDFFQKVKKWYEANKSDLYIAAIIFLIGMAGFGLGRLSILWIPKEPITVDELQVTSDPALEQAQYGAGKLQGEDLTKPKIQSIEQNSASIIKSLQGQFVGSKNGISYHFPWCPGAQKIKEENKIWFQTRKEAESRGYKPAGNCPGL